MSIISFIDKQDLRELQKTVYDVSLLFDKGIFWSCKLNDFIVKLNKKYEGLTEINNYTINSIGFNLDTGLICDLNHVNSKWKNPLAVYYNMSKQDVKNILNSTTTKYDVTIHESLEDKFKNYSEIQIKQKEKQIEKPIHESSWVRVKDYSREINK